MPHPVKTIFKDAVVPGSYGSSDLGGDNLGKVSLLKGDLEVNGQKVVVGLDVHDHITNVE